ncbi:ATP phosphoribosyltransferase [Chloroflexota bacterium]
MQIKIALPKGRLLKKTSAILQKANWGLDEYHSKADFYHPKSQRFPDLKTKILHEKDIPIQVAVGNYDIGICGLDWIEELLVKYPSSALIKVKSLAYGYGVLYITASPSQTMSTLAQVESRKGIIRIASEYPNLAESFALKSRLSRFSIYPVWGGAEAYPPDSADLSLITAVAEAEVWGMGVVPIARVLDYNACIVANKNSWKTKDLHDVVASINGGLPSLEKDVPDYGRIKVVEITEREPAPETGKDTVRIALPDGHQQKHVISLLNRAGIEMDDYPSATGNRRPSMNMDGVTVKVIRPQDMPFQIANGNFDLAITGRDWLFNHLYQFPSSPVAELLDLKYGKVKIVAVIHRDVPADNIQGLRELYAERAPSLRVASEYINIADKYARDNHLGNYRVVPTWGATEAFLPDDADMLIENTETGRTIARHNLKIIDTIFVSTACLIRNTATLSPEKSKKLDEIVSRLKSAVEEK